MLLTYRGIAALGFINIYNENIIAMDTRTFKNKARIVK